MFAAGRATKLKHLPQVQMVHMTISVSFLALHNQSISKANKMVH
jgi:hypothetical protein